MEIEQYQIRRLPGTLSFYETEEVCALENVSFHQLRAQYELSRKPSHLVAQTLFVKNESDSATAASSIIMHCGACGHCSNPHDIKIYADTKDTLFDCTLACGKHAIFGPRAVSRCMSERFGFTSGCNDCWVENIMCDFRLCIFSCAFEAIFESGLQTKGKVHTLNKCTNCDEIRCGPQFIKCAGANRRRCSILTDLKRNDSIELCHAVHPPNWYSNDALRQLWESQQTMQPEVWANGDYPITQGWQSVNPHDSALPSVDAHEIAVTSLSSGGRLHSRRLGGPHSEAN